MDSPEQVTVTIYFVEGEPLRFTVLPDEAKLLGLSDDVQQALQRTAMAVEIDNSLKIIPYSNIKYIEIDPAPSGLPITVIKGAKRV
jgi:hypothetical protein